MAFSKPQNSPQQLYDRFVVSIQSRVSCPNCQNSSGLTRHGSYPRQLYITRNRHVSFQVTRLRCHSCSVTFALLPACIVPFKRYILDTILLALRLFKARSIYAVESQMDISAHLVQEWRRQFTTWHKALYISHELDALESDTVIAQTYARLRLGKRLMQVISAWTPRFHML